MPYCQLQCCIFMEFHCMDWSGCKCQYHKCHWDKWSIIRWQLSIWLLCRQSKECRLHGEEWHWWSLCGGCRDGFSLAIGSSRCIPCSNNSYLALLIFFSAAGFLLVFLISVLIDLTVSCGMINGLILYANIYSLGLSEHHPTTGQQQCPDKQWPFIPSHNIVSGMDQSWFQYWDMFCSRFECILVDMDAICFPN